MKDNKGWFTVTVGIVLTGLLLFTITRINNRTRAYPNNFNDDGNNIPSEEKEVEPVVEEKVDEQVSVIPIVNVMPPVITLLGENEVTVEVNSSYTDSGATGYDNIDMDITGDIVVNNPVDITKIGDYTITYDVKNSNLKDAETVRRVVHVVDTTAPVVNVLYEEIELEATNDSYVESNVSVYDNSLEVITPSMTIKYKKTLIDDYTDASSIDLSIVGMYLVTYGAVDSSNNVADEVSVVINVVDTTDPTITFSREGTDSPSKYSYVTVSISDISDTLDRYVFVPFDGLDPSDDDYLLLPSNGVVNPSTDGSFKLYVMSEDVYGNKTIKSSSSTFVRDSSVLLDKSIEITRLTVHELLGDDMTSIVIDLSILFKYSLAFNNIDISDIRSIDAKVMSGENEIVKNSLSNHSFTDITNLLENTIYISGTYASSNYGVTSNVVPFGFSLDIVPTLLSVSVLTYNDGIFNDNFDIVLTDEEWASILGVDVSNVTLVNGDSTLSIPTNDSIVIDSNNGKDILVKDVTNINVGLYQNDTLLIDDNFKPTYDDDTDVLDDIHNEFLIGDIISNNPLIDILPTNVVITITYEDDVCDFPVTRTIDLNLTEEEISNIKIMQENYVKE